MGSSDGRIAPDFSASNDDICPIANTGVGKLGLQLWVQNRV